MPSTHMRAVYYKSYNVQHHLKLPTNDELSSVRTCDIHLRSYSEEMLKTSILDMKTTNLGLQAHLPGADEIKTMI